MCNHDNQVKRSVDGAVIDARFFMENPRKRQCKLSDKPSFVSLMQASILRRKQGIPNAAIKGDNVLSEAKPNKAFANDDDETLMDEEFQPGNWHVVCALIS